MKPCSCTDDEIACGDIKDIDLVKIFQTQEKNLTKTRKHFKLFYLSKTFITELKENTFSDITFDVIWIRFCSKLKTIHVNAFNTTDQVTTDIYIEHNPVLTSPDNSIFQVLSKFIRAKLILLRHNNKTEIPSNAFRNIVGKQEQLNKLEFGGSSFKRLGNNAFSVLNLEYLTITVTSIDIIPENAFEFNVSDRRLLINLANNYLLDNTGFAVNSLTRFNRPTIIDLRNKRFPYLDEKIFLPFLLSNTENMIELRLNSLNCIDFRNYWILTRSELINQLFTR